MQNLITSWADFVIERRTPVLVATVALLALCVFTGPEIPFDNATERYFVEGDPTLEDYDRLIELFGDNEYFLIGFEAASGQEDVFHPDTLSHIAILSDFLEGHPAISQVRSLSNYEYIHADGDDLSVDYLIDDIEALAGNPSLATGIKDVLRGEPLALGTLITEDFRHTRIAARVEHRDGDSEHKVQLAQDMYRFIEEQQLGSDAYLLHLSGYPQVYERYETVSAEDLELLIPVMIVLMLGVLLVSFRSAAAMIFPWLVIAAGLLLVLEIQSYLELPHSTVDSALMPTLIIIGIGISVHLLVDYFHFTGKGRSGEESARLAISHIFRPALFTAVTTAAGFYALSFTRIEPVRDFALLGAIGPLALFLFAMTVLPALLSFHEFRSGKKTSADRTDWVSGITAALPDFTSRNRKIILLFGIVVMLFSVASVPFLNVDNNYVTLFKEDSIVRQDIEYFDREFRGMMTLDVILDSGEENGVRDPQFLRRMDTFQSWLQEQESLGPINSLTNYLKEINMALHGDDPAYYSLPETAQQTAQYLLLYESAGAYEDLSDIKDFDERYTRLTIPIVNMPGSEMQVELDAIQDYLDNNQQELQPMLTGTMVLFTVQDMYTSEGMFRSFTIAMLVISVFFILLFRSLKYGILSLIPSILPIVFTASLVSMVGIYLDLAMLIVGAMTMGIAVDDAIHVMNRYLMARKQGDSARDAITRAMNESGRAVIFSSIVLVLGFSVLSLGSFTTIIFIGIFGSVIMALALLGDLLLLPAILHMVDGRKEQASPTA